MKTVAGIMGAVVGGLALFLLSPAPSEAQARKKVSMQLDWVVSGNHAGFFVAKEKGLYAASGLEVAINRGFGSGDTAKVVAAGKSEFGSVTIPVVITSRGKGAPLVAVTALYAKAPESFVSLEEKGIRHPKDVVGTRFAEAPGGSLMVTWPAFAKLVGVDPNKVTFVAVEPATKPAVFFGGRVDWIFGFRSGGLDAVLIARARREGKRLRFVRWEDYGWKTHGNAITTHDRLLKDDPKVVGDFVDATLEGYRWTIEHPDQALDILIKANPEIDRTAARLTLLFAIEGLLTKAAQEHGLGYMEPDRIAFQIDLMSKLLNFPPPRAEDVYTNRFIKKRPITVTPALQAELNALP
ncbi:MAG: ABC transporter substrate-binding protein [Deltaproteobacteria bacterium]|nr:ABC transporter substrate-binding protein [Deltaproteobacteria bacterium]